ncbi:unnamed protein product [Ostreobium quekettii]|uniref:Nucleotide-diphospho-sugar transferase domain-containing protein n=1 Tax=Ostreobium quekettii TaxID=121088 RepID=A0A8S1JB42_9CHLO|nr:unnamed protein product [Ostreobium quekettii]
MRGAQARRCHPWALVLPTTALIFFLLGRLNSRPLPRAGGRHVLPVQVPTVPHALAFDDEQDSAASRGWPPREQVARLAKCGRIVLAIVNCGFLDFADNWAQSLLRAGVGHFAFVPLDQNAYAQLREHYPEHTIPPLPSELGGTELPDSKEHTYGTPEYFRLIRGRQTILLRFLHQGHAVFLSDVDTVWMSDALDEVPIGMYDMMAADDGDMNIPVGTGHGMYVCAGRCQ